MSTTTQYTDSQYFVDLFNFTHKNWVAKIEMGIPNFNSIDGKIKAKLNTNYIADDVVNNLNSVSGDNSWTDNYGSGHIHYLIDRDSILIEEIDKFTRVWKDSEGQKYKTVDGSIIKL